MKGSKQGTNAKAALFIPVVGVAFMFVSATGSFFLDNEKSATNTLGAAETFTEATPTPAPTPTPTPIETIEPSPTSTDLP
jgi:hypothetical protein